MKNLRRFLTILLIGCGMITFLAGCNDSQGKVSKEKEIKEQKEKEEKEKKEKEVVNTLIAEQCDKLAGELAPFYDGKFDSSKVAKISDNEWQYVVIVNTILGQLKYTITVRRAGDVYRASVKQSAQI